MFRRQFLKTAGKLILVSSTVGFPLELFSKEESVRMKTRRLTILHTNDVHSRLDPFPMDGGPNQGLGGVAKRAEIINKIRAVEKNVLLLDSGDMFQGTPYFNYFKGELEIKAMTAMGYDAATLGNHDFDAGLENLKKQLQLANFPILISNYDFSNTAMNGAYLPYKVFEKEGLKIGVFGLGIELNGLVSKPLFGDTIYQNPVEMANKTADTLRHDFKCDYIVCMSHLGYKYDTDKVSDVILAKHTRNIDLILGGHTHTLFEKPDHYKNLEGKEVTINQVGWAGLVLGRIDVIFEPDSHAHAVGAENQFVK